MFLVVFVSVMLQVAAAVSVPLDISSMTNAERRSASIQIFNAATESYDPLVRERQEDTYILVSEAIRLYPEQIDIDSFETDLAWMMLYRSFVASELGLSGQERWEGRTARGITLGPSRSVFSGETVGRCPSLRWLKQPPVRNFGRAVFNDGGYVAALAGFDIDEEGRPSNIRFLGMMPEDSRHLRTVTRRALNKWRADPASMNSNGCQNELLTMNYTAQARYRLQRW